MKDDSGKPVGSGSPVDRSADHPAPRKRPQVYLLPDRLLFLADRYSGAHSLNFGISVLLALNSQRVTLRRANGRTVHCRNAIFRAHEVTGIESDAPFASIQLYPASGANIALSRHLDTEALLADSLPALKTHTLRAAADTAGEAARNRLAQATDKVIEMALGHSLRVLPIDRRVLQTRDTLLANPPKRVNLSELADAINLSGDRLTHLFSDQAGMPLRSFALWCKAHRAIEIFAQRPESDWASIAHDAGFADLSHCIRTMKKFFGISPGWVRSHAAPTFVFLNSRE